jgi:hypothetical protein
MGSSMGFGPENQVRPRLTAGGKWIRTIGPPPEIVVDPSGSRRDHRAKYGCLSARPRVRCLCPPGKTQLLLPKSVFDRPGSDRWNLASTTFPDAGPMVRIHLPPAVSLLRTSSNDSRKLINRGIRHLQLVHYTPNDIGDFQTGAIIHQGLTSFGAEVICACHRLGFVCDVAHTTEGDRRDRRLDRRCQPSSRRMRPIHSCTL